MFHTWCLEERCDSICVCLENETIEIYRLQCDPDSRVLVIRTMTKEKYQVLVSSTLKHFTNSSYS